MEDFVDVTPPPLTPPLKGEGDSPRLFPSPLRGGVRGGGVALQIVAPIP